MPFSSRTFSRAFDKLNEFGSSVTDDPQLLLKLLDSQGEHASLKFSTSPLSGSPSEFTVSDKRLNHFCNWQQKATANFLQALLLGRNLQFQRFTFRLTTSFDILPILGEPRLSYPISLTQRQRGHGNTASLTWTLRGLIGTTRRNRRGFSFT